MAITIRVIVRSEFGNRRAYLPLETPEGRAVFDLTQNKTLSAIQAGALKALGVDVEEIQANL